MITHRVSSKTVDIKYTFLVSQIFQSYKQTYNNMKFNPPDYHLANVHMDIPYWSKKKRIITTTASGAAVQQQKKRSRKAVKRSDGNRNERKWKTSTKHLAFSRNKFLSLFIHPSTYITANRPPTLNFLQWMFWTIRRWKKWVAISFIYRVYILDIVMYFLHLSIQQSTIFIAGPKYIYINTYYIIKNINCTFFSLFSIIICDPLVRKYIMYYSKCVFSRGIKIA